MGIIFKVTEIYSNLSAIRRRIDVINKKTNSILSEVLITLGCDDPNDNLYRKIGFEPENFSGQITIETNHLLEYTKKVLNGKLVKVERIACKDPEPNNAMDGSCPLSSINSCINDTYYDMNWLDFAICTIKGSYCYFKSYANCKAKLCS
jgi:hypothetical protein